MTLHTGKLKLCPIPTFHEHIVRGSASFFSVHGIKQSSAFVTRYRRRIPYQLKVNRLMSVLRNWIYREEKHNIRRIERKGKQINGGAGYSEI